MGAFKACVVMAAAEERHPVARAMGRRGGGGLGAGIGVGGTSALPLVDELCHLLLQMLALELLLQQHLKAWHTCSTLGVLLVRLGRGGGQDERRRHQSNTSQREHEHMIKHLYTFTHTHIHRKHTHTKMQAEIAHIVHIATTAPFSGYKPFSGLDAV